MSTTAASARRERPPTPRPRVRREEPVYVVEVDPTEPDPRVAEAVRRWLLARMR